MNIASLSLIPSIILALMALYCAGQALAVFADPAGLAQAVHYTFTDASGRAEFVALYGGFFLGLGAFFGYGVVNRAYREPGLFVLTVTMAVTAAARAAVIATAPTAPVSTTILFFEIGFAAVGAVGWWAERRSRASSASGG